MAKNKKKKKDKGAVLNMDLSDRVEVRANHYYDCNAIMVASHGRYATTAIYGACGKNAWIFFDPDMDDDETVRSQIVVKCSDDDILEWNITRTGNLDTFIEDTISSAVAYDGLDPIGGRGMFTLEDRIKKMNNPVKPSEGFRPGFCYLRPYRASVWRIVASTRNDPGEVVSGIVSALSAELTRPTVEYQNLRRSEKKGLMFSPMYFGSHPNECVKVDINMISIDEMNLISEIMKRTGIDTNKAVKAFLHQFGLRTKLIRKEENDPAWKYTNPFGEYAEYDDDPF